MPPRVAEHERTEHAAQYVARAALRLVTYLELRRPDPVLVEQARADLAEAAAALRGQAGFANGLLTHLPKQGRTGRHGGPADTPISRSERH